MIINNNENILPIIIYPDKRLATKAKPIKKITKYIKDIANKMINTMVFHRAIGLSGTQVNYHKRIICFVEQNSKAYKVMINPTITNKSDDLIKYQEGCLSIPETYVEVPRHREIEVKYQSLSGEEIIETYCNLNSIIIQHEIDHLNGKLMIE
jgi:peptide deformylase